MTDGSIWDEVLDTEHVIVVRTYIERWPRKNKPPEKVLVVVVEPDDEARNRCPGCGNRGVPVESDVRRWRTLDVHGKRCFLEYAVPRIECAVHGKITAAVPWARHDDRFTLPFEDHAAWLAGQMPWTKASAELRVTWEALASPAAFFGNEVREARTRAKMSQVALGAATGYDATYVSKVETGAIVPDEVFVNALDQVFPHMNGWFARFWSNSRKWEGQYPAWFKDWIEAELHARMIRWWEPLLIPGLLQTADYARELFRAWQTIEDADMVERNVTLRMDRQGIFDRLNPPTLLAVIDETVLWRCIGNAEIMRTQLAYLIDMSTRPNIAIHIVPASVGAHAGLLGAFILADLEGEPGKVAYLETPDQGLISDAARLTAKTLGMFEQVRSEALPKGASRELIRRVVSERWTP